MMSATPTMIVVDAMRRIIASYERAFAVDCTCQLFEIVLARNLDRAELFEVRRHPLDVEQGEPARAQALHERGKRELRGVGRAMEHRLAKERASDGDAIQAAGKCAVLPDLHRMREAEIEKALVAVQNLGRNPRAVAVGPSGARLHDVDERGVDANVYV